MTAYLKIADNSVLTVDRSFSSSPAQDVLEATDAYRKNASNGETGKLRMFTGDVRDEIQNHHATS